MVRKHRHQRGKLWPWLVAAVAVFLMGLLTSHQLDDPWAFRVWVTGAVLGAASGALGMWRTGPVGITAHWLIEDAYAALWGWLLIGLFFFTAGFAFSLLGSFFVDPRFTLDLRTASVIILGACVVLGVWRWLRG